MRTELERGLAWLAGRDTGASSKAICLHMLGHRFGEHADYPRDPDDLGRCLRLLDLMPEWKLRLSEMAAYGPVWRGLVEKWDHLAAMMADEVGVDWSKGQSAPLTYEAIRAIRLEGTP